jgi:hypothetical protein
MGSGWISRSNKKEESQERQIMESGLRLVLRLAYIWEKAYCQEKVTFP